MSSRETKSNEWAGWMNSKSEELCLEGKGAERCEHGSSNCIVGISSISQVQGANSELGLFKREVRNERAKGNV